MKKELIVIAGVLAVAGSALAKSPATFKKADKDGNNSLSQSEYVEMKSAQAKKNGREAKEKALINSFKKKDTNKDGKLSSEEFMA